MRELVLEEHEACACSCLTITASQCMRPELFDPETCSCRCDSSVYHRDRLQCEQQPPDSGMIWDETTCSCVDEVRACVANSLIGGQTFISQIRTLLSGDDFDSRDAES